MKFAPWVLAIFLVTLLLTPAAAGAAEFVRVYGLQTWDTIYTSARSSALGHADLAVLQGPTAMFDNPGRIVDQAGLEIGYDQYDYVSDIDLKNFGLGYRFGSWALMAGLKTFSNHSPVRTAFAPEGTGEFVDLDQRVLALGASYDLAPRLLANPHTTWTWGLTYRHSSSTYEDETTSQGDLDLGTTFRLQHPLQGGLLEFSAAGALMNVLGNHLEDGPYAVDLPQTLSLGVGLSAGLGVGRFDRDGLRFTLAATWVKRLNDFYDDTGLNYGAEAVIYHLVALRAGHDELRFGGVEGYGVGLLLDEWVPGPVGLRLDFSSVDPGTLEILVDEDRQKSVSLNAVWAF